MNQCRLGDTELLPGKQHGGTLYQALPLALVQYPLSQHLNVGAIQYQRTVAPAGIEGDNWLDRDAALLQGHQAGLQASFGTAKHDRHIRHGRVRDGHLFTGDLRATAVGFKPLQGQSAGALCHRHGRDAIATGQLRQPLRLLRLSAKALNRLARQIHRAAERQGCCAAAHFLGNDRQLVVAQAEAAVSFINNGRGPAHVGDFSPESGIPVLITVEHRSDNRG